jgi:membrane protein implicated in regulation of membrane protease activity
VLKLIIELVTLNLELPQIFFFEIHAIAFVDVMVSLVVGPTFSAAFTTIKLLIAAMYIFRCVEEKTIDHHETVKQSHSLIERVENLEKEHKMLQAKHEADTKTFPLLVNPICMFC